MALDEKGREDMGLDELYQVILRRRAQNPQGSYVANLSAQGEAAMLRKVGEESLEVILAAREADPGPLVHELADLWFHLLVFMAHRGITPAQVQAELARRRKGSEGVAP
ncbi:MAG: phosphoribosyl-ATP diphosphatase [Deltaproteobacteria bacterium]|nr:phosphoribosyl-ATP diphosphatase [Deltaproteobacteria bacterium]